MAKRTPRTEASDTSAPAAEPKARPERRPRTRETATADTFAARSDATESPSDAPVSESGSAPPSEEHIRMRAYMRYLERGGLHGLEFEDWLEAERELKDGK